MAVSPSGGYKYKATIQDQSDEKSSWQVHLSTFLDINNTLFPPLLVALNTAVFGLIEGVTTGYEVLTTLRQNPVAHGIGNREDKWAIHYHDNANAKRYVFTLPTRRSTVLTVPGTDFVSVNDPLFEALATAMQAVVSSPDGNGVTLDGIELVGRNI